MPRWPWRRTLPPADTLPDATLMERVVAGDEDAFAHLVARHEQALFNYLLRMTQDDALAADLMQETWLRVFQNAPHYDTVRKFSTWLFTIASHCCIDALRVRQRLEQHTAHAPRRVPSPDPRSNDPQEALLDKETLAAVRAAVQTLPELQRAVFILRHYHGLSYQDISDIVQCSLGTVKSRLHHAVRHLQRILATR
jgi:RNA polymerase sigma-70 factor (ECF subfamily)